MSNAFIQALLMDDPDAGSGGGTPVDPDFPSGCVGDPDWDDVALALNFEQADGSVVMVDTSSHAQNRTITSGASVRTAAARYGSAGLRIDQAIIDAGYWEGTRFNSVAGKGATIEFYFKPLSRYNGTAAPALFMVQELTFGNAVIEMSLYGLLNEISIRFENAFNDFRQYSYTPDANGWVHVAICVGAAGGARIYLNQTLVVSRPNTEVFATGAFGQTPAGCRVFVGRWASGPNTAALNCYLDSFRYTTRDKYLAGVPAPRETPACDGPTSIPDPTVACLGFPHYNDALLILNFDGTVGSTTFTDSSTYNRVVTRTWGDAALASGQKYGTACLQGGDTTQLTWNTSGAEWDAPEWTLRCWYYRTSDHPSGHSIFHFGGSSNYPRVQLWTPNDGGPSSNYYKLVLWHYNATAWLLSNDPIPLGVWTLLEVAVRRVGLDNIAYMFVNGVLQMTQTQPWASYSFGLYKSTLGDPIGGSIGRTDQAGFTNINAKIDQWSLTRVCEHTASYDVPSLPYCSGTTDVTPTSIPGTEALTGLGMATTAGDVNTPSGSRKLVGQAMTTATGSVSVFNANRTVSLVGANITAYRGALAALPYPDLLSDTREFVFSPVWESMYLTVLNNGTFTISETDLSVPAYTGNWLAPTAMDVTTIASQYRGTGMTNYGAGALDYTDLAPTALFSVSTTATSSVQKIHHFSITVVPTLTNPRYGEVGYQGVLRFRLALKLP